MPADFEALKKLLQEVHQEGADEEDDPKDQTKVKPSSIVMIGSQSAGMEFLVKEVQRHAVTLLESKGARDVIEPIDVRAAHWADYQIANVVLPLNESHQTDVVIHMIQTDGNSNLGDLIGNSKAKETTEESGVIDSGGGEKSSNNHNFYMNRWLSSKDEDPPTLDPLATIRPPSCVADWRRTVCIAVLTLNEASSLLLNFTSHVEFLRCLLLPILRKTTTSEERSDLTSRQLFPDDLISKWRVECGLSSNKEEGEEEEEEEVPFPFCPLLIVVNRGDLVDRLKERAYTGERDIIEMSLLKKCHTLGASCVFVDCGPRENDAEEVDGFKNVDVLTDAIHAMINEELLRSLPPPFLPVCLGLPCVDEKSLLWVPHGVLSKKRD
eukprot:GHVH01008451.1.p1 GENE.GHVH01008451.1~~GHVH01008451.1.p1  ORF type:complete len:381 (+),score=53.14 GHVH01008451.1:28-1170(+)